MIIVIRPLVAVKEITKKKKIETKKPLVFIN